MGFSVTILGSNSALPTSERNPTAQVLSASGRFFLIDCGEGTQMQLRRNRVHFGRINHIFISHLHGDHVFGLPGLISSYGLLGRSKDLHIYCHPDLEMMMRPFMAYFSHDLPYKVIYHHIEYGQPGVIFEDDVFEVLTIALEHRIPTVGFLFREKPKERNINKSACDCYEIPLRWFPHLKKGDDFIEGSMVVQNEKLTFEPIRPKSYAFCTDTRMIESVIPALRDIDLLYHEATFLDDQEALAHKTFHSTARQAASVARSANVGKLLLGHFSSRYKDLQPFLDEARTVFGNSEIAQEGRTFEV
jgi:ribonuclease Z